ncbi:myb SANT-like DNA-binding domain-containing 4 [Labeo rohita]|uniref:Myb SANT-like DNA-binding domain-containing 4 n=1 Tax=Labeo rohita TaxID=84645 RepID=A0A498N6X1_LABRO|nr:myb SANT-like DNA-binding domain-containing 4 [Labeo rohita]
MEKKRNRKPNWTEEQGLLLAQLVNEHKGMLRGKFGPTVTSQGKRRAWDTISQTINASFPLVVRTGDDCEKRWYVLQSKAKDEIAAHKRESSLTGGGPPAKRLSQVADTVFQVLGHSEVSVTGLPTGIDTSMMQALEVQQSGLVTAILNNRRSALTPTRIQGERGRSAEGQERHHWNQQTNKASTETLARGFEGRPEAQESQSWVKDWACRRRLTGFVGAEKRSESPTAPEERVPVTRPKSLKLQRKRAREDRLNEEEEDYADVPETPLFDNKDEEEELMMRRTPQMKRKRTLTRLTVKREERNITAPMIEVSGPDGPMMVFRPWTALEAREAMAHLPDVSEGGVKMSTELVRFCEEFSPTMTELRRFLLSKLGPSNWYLQIRDFVKSDISNYVTAAPMYLDTFLERCLRDGSTISLLYKGLEQGPLFF